MPKRSDHAAVLRRYVAGERVDDIAEVLRTVPADIDAAVVRDAALIILGRSIFWFGKSCRNLPAAAIRAVLSAEGPGANHLFLRLAVRDDDDLVASWQRAVAVLPSFDLTYAWGSKQRRERFRMLARDRPILEAIQGTVATSRDVPLDMLAVLVVDGSAESIDALIPHLDAALVGQDRRLDRLTRLRTHATRTPALDALFAEIEETIDVRNAASPALALAPLLGLPALDLLWFDARFGSVEMLGTVPLVQVTVCIDSRAARWFSLHVWRDTTYTSFDDAAVHRDDVGLGRCAADAVPAWLAKTAAQLGVEWAKAVHVSSNLRGARRDLIGRWLIGS